MSRLLRNTILRATVLNLFGLVSCPVILVFLPYHTEFFQSMRIHWTYYALILVITRTIFASDLILLISTVLALYFHRSALFSFFWYTGATLFFPALLGLFVLFVAMTNLTMSLILPLFLLMALFGYNKARRFYEIALTAIKDTKDANQEQEENAKDLLTLSILLTVLANLGVPLDRFYDSPLWVPFILLSASSLIAYQKNPLGRVLFVLTLTLTSALFCFLFGIFTVDYTIVHSNPAVPGCFWLTVAAVSSVIWFIRRNSHK